MYTFRVYTGREDPVTELNNVSCHKRLLILCVARKWLYGSSTLFWTKDILCTRMTGIGLFHWQTTYARTGQLI